MSHVSALDDPKGPFQPKPFHGSTILCFSFPHYHTRGTSSRTQNPPLCDISPRAETIVGSVGAAGTAAVAALVRGALSACW